MSTLLLPSQLEQVIIPPPLIVSPDELLAGVLLRMSQVRESGSNDHTNLNPMMNCLDEVCIGCVLVVDNHRLTGILTEQDLVRWIVLGVGEAVKVSEVMRACPVVLVRSQLQSLLQVLLLFQQHPIQHIPVVDDQEQPIGLVTPISIGQVFLSDHQEEMHSVREVMTRIISASPNSTLSELAKLMVLHQASLVLITEDPTETNSNPIGIISEHDIVRLWIHNLNFDQIAAHEVVNPLRCSLSHHQSLRKAHQIMQQQKVRYAIVTGDRGDRVGIVTQSLLLQAHTLLETNQWVQMLQRKVEQLEAKHLKLLQNYREQQQSRTILYKLNHTLKARIEQRARQLEQLVAQLQGEIIHRQHMEAELRIRTEELQNTLTERNQLEQKRSETEAWLHRQLTAVEASIDGIAILRGDQYIYLNQAHARIFGYETSDQLLDKTWKLLYSPDEIERFEQERFPVLFREGSWQGEATAMRQDGSTFAQEVSLTLTEDGDLVCICRDISKRKQTETNLILATQLQKAILDSTNYSIISTDADGIIQIFNPTAQRLLGYSPDEVIGRFLPEAVHDAQEIQQNAQSLSIELEQVIQPGFEALVAKARQGLCDEREWMYVRKDGSQFPVLLSINALRDEQNNITGFLEVGNDITKRKQAETEACRTLEREKELNELKSRFISNTSHEFRTPLSVIASSAGILQNFGHRLSESQRRHHLQCIQTYVKHTTQLLDDILLLNRAEAGKLSFNPAALELVDFCQRLIDELQMNQPRSVINFGLPGASLGRASDAPVIALVDEKLLRQILSNLLSNAVKYSPEDSVIGLSLHIQENRIVFRIQDSGVGIPPEDIEQLFQPFHRAKNVGNIPGTGLGLSIVKRCVDLHGGQITVTSQVGMGSVFSVVLPLQLDISPLNSNVQQSG